MIADDDICFLDKQQTNWSHRQAGPLSSWKHKAGDADVRPRAEEKNFSSYAGSISSPPSLLSGEDLVLVTGLESTSNDLFMHW